MNIEIYDYVCPMSKPIAQTVMMAISKLVPNDDNPREIREEKLEQLKKSLTDFKKMLTVRPIVVNEQMVILSGSMRFQAAKALGWKEVPVMVASGFTDAEQREFIIKDNVHAGQFDFETLANEWDAIELADWGLEIPGFDVNFNPNLSPDTGRQGVTAGELRFARNFIANHAWKFAKTMPENPHEYVLSKNTTGMSFLNFFRLIILYGKSEQYGSRTYQYLYLDGKKYWVMDVGEAGLYIVNRADA